MTDKERLEEIKRESKQYGKMTDPPIFFREVYETDFKWLIEQAERVQELEDFKRKAEQLYKNYHLSAKKSVAEKEELREQNKRYREKYSKMCEEMDTQVIELEKQNKRYREALEEIARGRFPGASYKARKALEG